MCIARDAIDRLVVSAQTRASIAGRSTMSWNLRGSYVETCSCELMCPCNLSFDHGATYDFCRVTLVFNIREGQVDGTAIGGRRGGALAHTPQGVTDGNWRPRGFIDE